MRIAVLALLVALCPFLASAQPIQGFDWGQVIDASTDEQVNDVAIGPLNGDRYAAGTWTRTAANSQASLGGLLGQVLTWIVSGFSLQGEDGMILSYPEGGGALQWAVIIGGSGNDGIRSICTDAAGNIYVAGYYSTGARIIQPNGTYFEMPATQGGTDLFVASFTATGTHRWHRTGGSAGADIAKGIACINDKVVVAGQVIGRPTMMGLASNTTLGAVSQANGILLQLMANTGDAEWRVDGQGGTSSFNDVAVDDDRAYLIGTFNGANCTAYHPGGAQSPQIAGSQLLDAVLMGVLRTNGAPAWLRSIRSGSGGSENEANGIAVDGTSVYLCGSTHNSSSFTGSTYSVTGSPHSHGYVSKHSKLTGGVEWMFPFYSNSQLHGITLRDIRVDANNTIWTTGAFYRDLNSNGTSLASTSNNRWQLSTLQLAWNGTLIKGYASDGNGDAIGNGVGIDASGRVFVGGEWRTLLNLRNSHTHTGDASANIFVTGMTDPGFPMWGTNDLADWVPFGPLCSNAAPVALNTRLRPLKFGTGKTVVASNNIPTSGANNGPQGALGTPDEGHAVIPNATAFVRIDLIDTIPAGASVTVRWLRTAATGTGQLLVSGSMAPATGFVSLGTPSSAVSTIVHTNLIVTSPIRYIRVAAPVGSAEIAVSGVYYAFGSLPGGTWSGSGVSGSTFSPAGLNGPVPVVYSVSGRSKVSLISVEALVVPGTITGAGTVCPGTDVPLALNGSSSTMSMWQIMPQGASVWTNTVSHTPTYTLPYVTVPHQVRARFAATLCPVMETPVVTVTPQDNTPPVLTCRPDTTIHTAPGTCQAPFTYAAPVMTDNCMGTAPASLPNYTFLGTFQGHTYFRSHNAGPWATALANVATLPGAQLLELNTAQEHDWIETRIMDQVNWYSPFWLGLTDEATEGSWRWLSGAPLTYTDWHPPQPDGSGNYGMLNLWGTTHWDDVPPSINLNWIVEFPSLPPTLPVRTSGPASGATFPLGSTTVSYSGTDQSGNTGTCSFNATVIDAEAPVLNCPANLTVTTAAGLCTAPVTINAQVADNCKAPGDIAIYWSHAPGTHLSTGITPLEMRAFDGVQWSATCTTMVNVLSNTPPVFATCPNNIVVNATGGQCGVEVLYDLPEAFAYCASTDDLIIAPGDPAHGPGNVFPVGNTSVNWTASGGGLSSTCSFNVTVIDASLPTLLNCPGDITMDASNGCGTVVNWTPPTASDNCTQVFLTRSGPAPGSTFLPGTTTVTYTATDLAGNTVSCTFLIRINDVTAPTIQNCPGNITLFADGGCGAVAIWNTPTATDGCAGVSITRTNGPASGLYLPKGDHPVTYTATDAAGNTATCTFLVRVIDNSPPTINNCPGNITVTADETCSKVVTWPALTVWDNCGGATIIRTPGPGPGDAFMVGVTTVTYVATDAAGLTSTCYFTVTVNTPVVTAGTYGPLCSNAAPITLNGTPAGGTWSGPGTSGNQFSPFGLSGTQTLTYTYTSLNGCSNSAVATIVVLPASNVSTGSYGPLCSNAAPITLSSTPAGGSWSGTGVSGNTFNPASGTQTLTYTVTAANGCVSTASTTITVNAAPTVSTGTYGPVCSNAAAITLNGTPTGGTWSGTGVSGNTFNPASGTQTLTYTVINASGCSRSASTTITVNAAPTASTGSYGPLCSNAAAITLNGTPTGGTWSGTGVSGNTFNPASGTQTLTYTVTNASGCSRSASTTITVNAAPTVSTGSYGPLCSNAAAITLNGTPTGGTWSGTGVSGNTFNPASGTQTLTYTVTNASGCTRSASTTITVNAAPTVSTGSYGPVCSNAAAITLNGTPTGGTWSGTGVSGNTFNPASGTQTLTYTVTNASGCTRSASTTITVNAAPTASTGSYGPLCSNGVAIDLSGTPTGGTWSGTGVSGNTFNPASGTQTITYTVINASGCSRSASTTITVNTAPVVAPGVDRTFCSNDAPYALPTITGSAWSGPGVSSTTPFMFHPANVPTGVAHTLTYTVHGAGDCFAQTTAQYTVKPTPAAQAPVVGPYCDNIGPVQLPAGTPANGTWSGSGVTGTTFQPTAGLQQLIFSATTNGCTDRDTVDVVVHAMPTVEAGSYPELCVSGAELPLDQASPANGNGGSGVWEGTGLTEVGFAPSAGTQTLTYTFTTTDNCQASDQVVILVHDLPTVSAGTDTVVCVNSAPLVLQGSPANGSWSISPVSPGSDEGLVGNTYDPSHGTQILLYGYTDVSGCYNSASLMITVMPVPEVTTGTYAPHCASAGPLLLEGAPSGGTWSGNAVTGDPTNGFSLANMPGEHDLIYTYTDVHGCAGSATTTAIILPPPSVNAGDDVITCADGATIVLSPTPAGGTWSGAVTDGTYPPSLGSTTLSYSYTDANGCVGHDAVNIQVHVAVLPSVIAPVEVCADADPVQLAPQPSGGTWSGGDVVNDAYDPSGGTAELTYTYTDASGCSASTSTTITVWTLDGLAIMDPGTLCASGASVTLQATHAGGTWSGSGITSAGVFNPAGGTSTVQYSIEAGECQAIVSRTIQVDMPGTVAIQTPAAICSSGANSNLTATPSGGTWSGNGINSSGIFNPQGLLGPVTVTYTVTQGACTISGNAVIEVLAQPTTNAGPDAVACDQLHALQADASAGNGTWTAPSGCILTDAHAPHTTVIFPGTGSYTFTWSEQNGQCTATDQVTIDFYDPLDPLWVDAGPDQDFDIYLSTAIPASAAPGTSVQWSVASGMATFLEPTSATTRVTDLDIGDNVLVITASFGTCRHVSDTMIVRVNDVFIPQGFSPNGDGVNDFFEVTGAKVFPKSELRVHDRWGVQVYRSAPYLNEWDGRGHAGAPLPNGTYYYFLELTPTRQYKGFVVIKR